MWTPVFVAFIQIKLRFKLKSVHRSTERRHFPKTISETYFRQSKVLLNALKRCHDLFLSFWSFPSPSEPFGIHQGRTVIFSKILVVTYSYAYENLRFPATSFHHYFRKRKICGSLLSQVIAKSVKWMWKTSSLKTKCFFFWRERPF